MKSFDYDPPLACKEAAAQLLKSKSILLVPHVRIDGDALGSMIACFRFFEESLGIKCCMYTPDKISERFAFMIKGIEDRIETELPDGLHFDTVLRLECPKEGRWPEGLVPAEWGDKVVNIDHHEGNDMGGDINWVEPEFSSLGEMLFFVFLEMGADFLKEIPAAEALYTAIVSDSGSFRFDSVAPRTLQAAANLREALGGRASLVHEYLSRISLNNIQLREDVTRTYESFCGGKLFTARLTKEMLDAHQAGSEDTDSLLAAINNVRGCQVFAFLKALDPDCVRVSLRSSADGPAVVHVAQKFGGGGHERAAACRFAGKTIDEAEELLLPELKALFAER